MSFETTTASKPEARAAKDQARDRSFSAAVQPYDNQPSQPTAGHIPRSASYTYFPQVKEPLVDEVPIVRIKGSISEDELATSHNIYADGDSYSSSGSGGSTPDNEAVTPLELSTSKRSLDAGKSQQSSKITISKFLLSNGEPRDSGYAAANELDGAVQPSFVISKPRSTSRTRNVFRRKSWIPRSQSTSRSTSRSNSPSKAEAETRKTDDGATNSSWMFSAGRRKSMTGRSRDADHAPVEPNSTSTVTRNGTVASKKPSRPLSALLRSSVAGSDARPATPSAPVPALPKSFSTDRLPILPRSHASSERIPPVPRTISSEKIKTLVPEVSRKKDELWSVFRTLESDLHKFHSKSTSLKANVVRVSLLPFLKTYASHPSIQKLRAEDLDRRTVILNKWWTGLLEMLHGRNNQSISGTDRPAILDGITGIMERPEWRLFPSPFCALADRKPSPAMLRSTSTTSLASNASDFLVESVHHNVRNTFIQNLLAQMAFVIDKMSLRNAPASTVSFCGKTCAYAFMFCPGVADVLIKLWNPSTNLMKRVVEENGPLKFLPSDTTKAERLCVPGMVFVHAQILTNLDATIHRNASQTQAEEPGHGSPTITFDDVLTDPDASATALPLPPSNAVRLMAENRLIMLIRDFLSERSSMYLNARHIFAEAFNDILKACAKKVSIYDHNACYTLIDFLEEAIVILVRYEHITASSNDMLDWPFWLSVYRRMIESQNTTTEIRLYAFLYSTWNSISNSQQRKADMCFDLLLDPEIFESRFNHWCPMVRAYFMRLLCWRLARFDGDADADAAETSILVRLNDSLRSVWSHFLYVRENAESQHDLLPSTAPCNPAPGRRLLIIRTDAPLINVSGQFFSFDGAVSPSNTRSSTFMSQSISDSALRPSTGQSDASDSSDMVEDTGKRRWGIFRSLMPGSSKTRSKSRSPDPPSGKLVRTQSAMSQATGSAPSTSSAAASPSQPDTPQASTHRTFCFKFSLEWVDKRFQTPGNARLFPPRLPMPAQKFLQAQQGTPPNTMPVKPQGDAVNSSKYAGRALAEWALVVNECQNFFERRKNEGVPANRLVETPTLGVEAFRRPG
ncbi:hypothetical protein H2201_001925 [Coniosporium apollinis]|uniref:DUF1765-domain-containing protein n=1 Tax=Coniosporium apollinis TaxID=61459 RepID=A0ABQ9P3I6_9PEZI|nr:hypothetical protein H2201_001925 [Coniosporium apollinis]